jgi:hypothetical protein
MFVAFVVASRDDAECRRIANFDYKKFWDAGALALAAMLSNSSLEPKNQNERKMGEGLWPE